MTLRQLFDVRFGSRLAPVLLPLVYLTVVVLTGLLGLLVVLAAAVHAWWLGLVALLVVPVVGLLVIALARVACELVWSVLKLKEYVEYITGRLPHLENVIDELASDMPPLGFLRRGATNRERATSASTAAPE
ncbi:MAG: DUF4282 domain-containing protein [Pseudonocardia sp.]